MPLIPLPLSPPFLFVSDENMIKTTAMGGDLLEDDDDIGFH